MVDIFVGGADGCFGGESDSINSEIDERGVFGEIPAYAHHDVELILPFFLDIEDAVAALLSGKFSEGCSSELPFFQLAVEPSASGGAIYFEFAVESSRAARADPILDFRGDFRAFVPYEKGV